jgi:hypothetical protein
VAAGGSDVEIQGAIAKAAMLNGQRPVVHLQGGKPFLLGQSVVVPANTDMQIIGDGIENEQATKLVYTASSGAGLVLQGPSKVVLRDLQINVNTPQAADALVVQGVDQTGARVLMDQTFANDSSVGVFADSLESLNLEGRAFYHQNNTQAGVRVLGGGTQGGRVAIFGGASSNHPGFAWEFLGSANVVVQDMYYEGNNNGTFLRLADSAQVSFQGGRYAASANTPLVSIASGFAGKLLLANHQLTGTLQMPALGANARVLVMGNYAIGGTGASSLQNNGGANSVFVHNQAQAANAATDPAAVADVGTLTQAVVGQNLQQLRQTKPSDLGTTTANGISDIRLIRVAATRAKTAIWIRK